MKKTCITVEHHADKVSDRLTNGLCLLFEHIDDDETAVVMVCKVADSNHGLMLIDISEGQRMSDESYKEGMPLSEIRSEFENWTIRLIDKVEISIHYRT